MVSGKAFIGAVDGIVATTTDGSRSIVCRDLHWWWWPLQHDLFWSSESAQLCLAWYFCNNSHIAPGRLRSIPMLLVSHNLRSLGTLQGRLNNCHRTACWRKAAHSRNTMTSWNQGGRRKTSTSRWTIHTTGRLQN